MMQIKSKPLTKMPFVKGMAFAIIMATSLTAMTAMTSCAPAKVPSFDAALDKHFASIAARDLDAYLATITNGETLPLIFPDGEMMGTRQEVEDFHKMWFAMPDWHMEFEPVSKIVGSDLATAIFKTGYRDTPDGEARYGYLALTFQLQDGEWRLVQDQNTRITTKSGA